MPMVDLVDETYVAAPPALIVPVFAGRDSWRRWWPTLVLELAEDRGVEGFRWQVTGSDHVSHDLRGTSEVWLERYGEGTIVHFYLRVDPVPPLADARRTRRLADRLRGTYAVDFKRKLNVVKDELEAGRAVGERPVWGTDRGTERSNLRRHG